jgi:zinc and cadmium transporter
MEIAYGSLSVLAVSLVSLIGAFFLGLKEQILKKVIFYLVSISVGALIGDAFIHLIPEVFEEGISGLSFAFSIFGGFIFFFILEKFLRWHHSHGEDEESLESMQSHDHSEKPLGAMVIISDGAHNIIDGILIGVSYLAGIEIGIATTIAVLLHEIPQEVGDFGLLLHAGFSVKKALLWNFISAIFRFGFCYL